MPLLPLALCAAMLLFLSDNLAAADNLLSVSPIICPASLIV